MKHILKSRFDGKRPVNIWYQSQGSNPWEQPSFKPQSKSGFQSGRYLLRETPKRLYQWNTRTKKSISPKAKELLAQTVLDNEEFNSKKKEEVTKGKSKLNAREKRSKCYICKTKGHAFWACEKRKKIAGVESQQKEMDMTKEIIDQERMYPEKVHVFGDYTIEGTDREGWDDIWYVSNKYKFHMCPRRVLFNDVNYKFKMVGKEEYECKFIFSYGIGNTTIKTENGDLVVRHVQYTPEVSLNILSLELLEKQGFSVKIKDTRCSINHMYYDEETSMQLPCESETRKVGPKEVVDEHNKYLEKYFESIDPDACSLVKGIEELDWNRDVTQDYVDDEYISYNGTLYALKVNSFSRFLSFMNLLKKDKLLYRNWEVFNKGFIDMLRWFYLVHLNYDALESIPPVVKDMELNLLCLMKAVENLGGYVSVTMGDNWGTLAQLQGLDIKDGETVRNCYKTFIDLVVVYHETASVPWVEKSYEVGEASKHCLAMDLQDQKDTRVKDGAIESKKDHFGVKLEDENEEDDNSSHGSNDFEVIV